MSNIAFIFPGQGSQYVGMGKDIYENYEEAKEVFEEASDLLGYDMAKLCFEGPKESLDLTENTQPALLTTSIAILKAVENHGIRADYAAGLSLGEYTSLVCSGALEFGDAVCLVKKRGRFMQEAVPQGKGKMAAILGLTDEKIYKVCEKAQAKGVVQPANLNCPGQIVIGGETSAVDYACEIAKEMGALKTVILPMSTPSHTPLLKPAAEKLEKELKKITFHASKLKVLSNSTAEVVNNKEDIVYLLVKQIMSPVLWQKTVVNLMNYGVDTFIEIGPGKTLCSLVKKTNRGARVFNIEDKATLEKTLEAVK